LRGTPYQAVRDEARRAKLRREEHKDEGAWVAIEAWFGKEKRADTLDMAMTKCKETSESAAMLLFFVMNLIKHALGRAGFLVNFGVHHENQITDSVDYRIEIDCFASRNRPFSASSVFYYN